MKMRLDRWLAALAVGSRSEVKQLIRGGQAAVDGRIVRDPALSFETETASLTLDGKPVDGRVFRHVMLYKPAGVLTAARDPKQTTVMDLLPPVFRGIGCMPVGRLDKDTTGLLLLTCDGELNHRLLSPARHVVKKYRALVEGTLGEEEVRRFSEGIDLGDFTAKPAELTLLGPSLAEAAITEGKFHQVRRMFAATGHEVLSLHRYAFGPLLLGPDLQEGKWRELTAEETDALYAAAGMKGTEKE